MEWLRCTHLLGWRPSAIVFVLVIPGLFIWLLKGRVHNSTRIWTIWNWSIIWTYFIFTCRLTSSLTGMSTLQRRKSHKIPNLFNFSKCISNLFRFWFMVYWSDDKMSTQRWCCENLFQLSAFCFHFLCILNSILIFCSFRFEYAIIFLPSRQVWIIYRE